MVWFINSLEQIGSTTNVFSAIDVIIVLIVSTILCMIIAEVYKITHDGLSYSQDFTQTLIIFGILVANIMLIIGSNIARAFTLVGALSIIRFRNAIKQTRDIGFIFFMMTVGMAVGTRFYILAVILTIFVCILIMLMKKYKFGSKKHEDEILKILLPKTISLEEGHIKPTLNKYLIKHQLISIEVTDNELFNEAVFLVRFKKDMRNSKHNLINDLKAIKNIKNAYLIKTEHLNY